MKKPLALLLCFACFNLFSTVARSQSFGSNNPVTCNGTEGYITIGGLVAGATYSVSYTDDGVTVGPLTFTANASGRVYNTWTECRTLFKFLPADQRMYYQSFYRNRFIKPDIHSNIFFHPANMCWFCATNLTIQHPLMV